MIEERSLIGIGLGGARLGKPTKRQARRISMRPQPKALALPKLCGPDEKFFTQAELPAPTAEEGVAAVDHLLDPQPRPEPGFSFHISVNDRTVQGGRALSCLRANLLDCVADASLCRRQIAIKAGKGIFQGRR